MKWEKKKAPPASQTKILRKMRREDTRVTAPLISWRAMLAIFGILQFLVVAQALIVAYYLDRIPALIGTLSYYLIGICFILTVLFGVFWRYVIGRPLKRIARAAKEVASGDFTVQIAPIRKGRGKNEVDVLIEDFNKMTRELAGNEMLKSDFIANVSHEIRAPLSVIQSYTKALKDPELTPALHGQYIDTIIEASQKMDAMITNILKLNKLEHQEIYPAPETYQLGEQLRRCALGFMEDWQAKQIDFSIDVADVAVCYDASLLELVWNNLLSNAVKYTAPGGKISLTSSEEDGVITVRIRDTGCGIRKDAQEKIFEKFYQADTSHASEGNGLGLALVKKVLEILKAEISVDSAPGKGTAFTVRLRAKNE